VCREGTSQGAMEDDGPGLRQQQGIQRYARESGLCPEVTGATTRPQGRGDTLTKHRTGYRSLPLIPFFALAPLRTARPLPPLLGAL
jgi:hypothetical protein